MNKQSEIEALLFVVGDEGIALEELSYLLELSTAQVYAFIQELNETYQQDQQRALQILEVGNQFKKKKKVI